MGSSVLGLVSSTSSASYLHYAAATPALPASTAWQPLVSKCRATDDRSSLPAKRRIIAAFEYWTSNAA